MKDYRTKEVTLAKMPAQGVREKGRDKEQSSTPVNWDTKD